MESVNSLLPKIRPLSPLNNMDNLKKLPNGSVDVSQFSRREYDIFFKDQAGVYGYMKSLSVNDQNQLLDVAQAKKSDAADILLNPFRQEVKDSGLYAKVKSLTGPGSGFRVRDLRQMSVDTETYDAPTRFAFKMRADALTNLIRQRVKLIQQAMKEDPEAKKAAEEETKKAEESALRVARAAYGLDNPE